MFHYVSRTLAVSLWEVLRHQPVQGTIYVLLGGLGLFFAVYMIRLGVRDGLQKQRIRNNSWAETYDTGGRAIARGVLYIFIGLFCLVGFVLVVHSIVTSNLSVRK